MERIHGTCMCTAITERGEDSVQNHRVCSAPGGFHFLVELQASGKVAAALCGPDCRSVHKDGWFYFVVSGPLHELVHAIEVRRFRPLAHTNCMGIRYTGGWNGTASIPSRKSHFLHDPFGCLRITRACQQVVIGDAVGCDRRSFRIREFSPLDAIEKHTGVSQIPRFDHDRKDSIECHQIQIGPRQQQQQRHGAVVLRSTLPIIIRNFQDRGLVSHHCIERRQREQVLIAFLCSGN
mmetsp:Transcript_3724/g.9003  ORF Transcript_3724/g.9003 Transcript_3724/m.9003 type:complete len:236 (-) Transcript_3724:400-1107(-)